MHGLKTASARLVAPLLSAATGMFCRQHSADPLLPAAPVP